LIEQEAKTGINDWLEELGKMLQNLIVLPSQASRFLAQSETGGLMVQSPQISSEMHALKSAVNRLTGGIIFFGLLLGGVLLYNAGNTVYGDGMLIVSFIALLWVLLGKQS